MKICLICGEIFAWGKYGGFGRATRTIGRELVKRGVDVSAVVPLRGDQRREEELDGMKVYGFPRWNLLASRSLYGLCDADIYHSQEPSLGATLAASARPDRKHAVTFYDPRDAEDWKIEMALPSRSRSAVFTSRLYESSWPVARTVRKADALYSVAHCVGERARRVFQLDVQPPLLPTPVEIPYGVRKADTPTVCCISRLDRRKRPEFFLQLVPKFPDVHFIMIGFSQDREWFDRLLERYRRYDNLDYRGFVDQFASTEVADTFSCSWILINAAAREGLPNAYLEAAAHGCAILSKTNPDGFASRFGHHADDDDFEAGLQRLLENENWRGRGDKGRAYVREHYETSRAIDQHMAAYQALLGDKP